MAECTKSADNEDQCEFPNYHKGMQLTWGENPADYSTDNKIFVYYVTSDITYDPENDVPMEYDIDLYLYENIPWAWNCHSEYDFCPNGEPAPPTSDEAVAILEAIGVTRWTLVITLLWDAPVDLDLHFTCPEGEIYYANMFQTGCEGGLDIDMQANHQSNVRGDGSVGQIENISLGYGIEGHVYDGRVKYYSGSGNAPYQLIFSGKDDSG